MNTWTPLWSSIIGSTLWEEPPHVRLVFLTLLALKDADGVVITKLSGLTRFANLPHDQVVEAVTILEAPDARVEPGQPPQEFEGRRIERVEGGWKVLNYLKYRDAISKVKRREYKRVWQKDDRAKKKTKAQIRSELEGAEARFEDESNGQAREDILDAIATPPSQR